MRELFNKLKNHGCSAKLCDEKEQLSGNEVLEQVQNYSASFYPLICPRSRVVLIGEYHCNWLIAFFTLAQINAVIIPLDKELPPSEMKKKIEFIEPQFILSLSHHLPYLEDFVEQDRGLSIGIIYINQKNKPLQQDETLVMIFSSGTGGKEKLIKLSAFTVCEVVNLYIREMNRYQCFNVLNVLPLTAIYPLSIVIATLLNGGHVILSNPKSNLVKLMQDENVECLPGVPMLLDKIYTNIQNNLKKQKHFKRIVFKSIYSILYLLRQRWNINFGRYFFGSIHNAFNPKLKIILSGGANFDRNKLNFLDTLGFHILEGYGLTELGGIVSIRRNNPEEFGSVGKVIEDIEIKIDESSQEILIKSPRLFSGYYKDEFATKEAMHEDWFRSGDIGYFDQHGYLHIVGRLKEVIIKADETKLLPEKLEEYYKTVVQTDDFAIAGVPLSNHSGDKVVIFIANADVNQRQEILSKIQQASDSSHTQFKIDQCLFVQELPRNKLGKICRQKLIKEYYASIVQEVSNESEILEIYEKKF
ncbi:TPA: AMP-binding protein [Legionella pneumophila]|nr:AMP-binding protein [Legionella pneumophila]HAT8868308.1 AMP-binding protein [Legionella pneumophila subsp. pneumophila]HAT7073216.1 AMP-binding protein [Legionella pneumophila]HAT8642258.1 AMP-binding protein [Legionella pneumophila]HAT8890559.1 AMP-binding protein [Legionella pneumophila subsp. pneumophila]HAT8933157.1 AMP-binding protein [Legionella pneumophila subsp. pneumophila]